MSATSRLMPGRWSPKLGPVLLVIVGIAATVATLTVMSELAAAATPAQRSIVVSRAWWVGSGGALSVIGASVALFARRYGLAKVIGVAPALWCAVILAGLQRTFH